MEKIRFHTIHIKVPENMVSQNKRGALVITPTLTKVSKNFTQRNHERAIDVSTTPSNKIEIIDDGDIVDYRERPKRIPRKKRVKRQEPQPEPRPVPIDDYDHLEHEPRPKPRGRPRGRPKKEKKTNVDELFKKSQQLDRLNQKQSIELYNKLKHDPVLMKKLMNIKT